ncbi:hydrolase 76 protein, partial [Rhizoclosmatium hyalinum]
TLLPLMAVNMVNAQLDVTDKGAVLAAAKAAMGPLQQYFVDPNIEGKGSWKENPDGRWVVQWHESGMYQDLFYQYALASGDGSNNGFATNNMYASAASGNGGDFMGGFSPNESQDGRWNDDIAWWALSSISGAEATGNADLRAFASTTFDQVWMSWDDKCGGGIYWSRNRQPGSKNPYLKSAITNVQMIDLGARLGHADKAMQIWNWMKSAGLVIENGGGYVILDRVFTNDCGAVSNDVFSYHAGEAMAGLSLMGQVDEAIKVFNGLKANFVGGDGILGPNCDVLGCNKNPSGYNWPVFKGLGYLYRATSDSSVKNSIASILKATAASTLSHCNTNNWDCMRNLGAGAGFTLISPDGKNVRDQFEAVSLLTAIIIVNGGGGFGPSVPKPVVSTSAVVVNATNAVPSRSSEQTTSFASTLIATSTFNSTSASTFRTSTVIITATAVAPAITTTIQATDSGNSVNGGAIAGGVVSGLGALAAISALGYYFYSKKTSVAKEGPFAPSETSQFMSSA